MSRLPSHQTLRRLTYFAAIAETGSIRKAAARLGLSVPVASEALSELEAELGVTLAHRTTRSFALTPAGETVRDAAADILLRAQSVLALGAPETRLTGRLAITLPVELTADWLPERLTRFCALHPDLEIAVMATDAVVDLGDRMIDVAVRTVYLPPGSPHGARETLPLTCIARQEGAVERHGPDHRLLGIPLLDRHRDAYLEGRDRQTGQTVRLSASRIIVIDNRTAAIAMARQGLGAALVLERSVREDLRSGQLVPVAPDLDFGAIGIEHIYRDAMPSPAARAFVAFLKDQSAPPAQDRP